MTAPAVMLIGMTPRDEERLGRLIMAHDERCRVIASTAAEAAIAKARKTKPDLVIVTGGLERSHLSHLIGALRAAPGCEHALVLIAHPQVLEPNDAGPEQAGTPALRAEPSEAGTGQAGTPALRAEPSEAATEQAGTPAVRAEPSEAATEQAGTPALRDEPSEAGTPAVRGPSLDGADDWVNLASDDETLSRRIGLLLRLKRAEDRDRAGKARIRALTAEQAALLRTSQERFQALAQNSTEGVTVTDADGTIRFISAAMERLLGWPGEAAQGQSLWTLLHPSDSPAIRDAWTRLLERPMGTEVVDIRIKDRVGNWRWLRVVAGNQLQAPGVHGIVLNCRDIQDERRIAAALQASQTRYRRMLDTTQEGIWATDERDRTLYVSQRLATMLGYRPEAMLGKPPTAFMLPEDVPAYTRRMESRGAGVVDNYEHRFVRSDGSLMWARVAASPVYDEAGAYSGSFGMLQDITAEKQADQDLRDALGRFTALIEESPLVAIQGFDRHGGVTLWNRACATLYGFTPEEAIGQNVHELVLLPEDIPTFVATLQDVWRSERPTPTTEWRVRTKSGEMRSVLSTMVPVKTGGAVSCVYCMDVDITERQTVREALMRSQAELQHLNLELEGLVEQRTAALKEAIEDLDSFAFSVTHDLRAPLRAVSGFAGVLVEECGDLLTGDALRYLRYITDNVQLMNTLIEELLTFSRCGRQHMSMRQMDMRAAVEKALQVQDSATLDRCEVVIGELPPCYGDPTLIGQVLTNLLSNALKYSRTREKPRIEVSSMGEQSGRVTYMIRDNGVGFDMLYADKLFAVFQRLHSNEEFEGVGVGLAIVRRILKRHGGDIWADSEPDKGATFFFTLPGKDPETMQTHNPETEEGITP